MWGDGERGGAGSEKSKCFGTLVELKLVDTSCSGANVVILYVINCEELSINYNVIHFLLCVF